MATRINWANQLTVARFWMAGIMLVCLSLETSWAALVAFILFAVASITDALDGWLARRIYGCSTFGKLMDPLADKVLTAAAFVGLVELGCLAAWMVTLILARELMVTGLRLLLTERAVVLSADQWGKWKTVVQMGVITVLLGGLVWPEVGLPTAGFPLGCRVGCVAGGILWLGGVCCFFQ